MRRAAAFLLAAVAVGGLLPVPPGRAAEETAEQGNPGPDHWIARYEEGLAIAKREGKDLFVDFTGSDWCTWCEKLDAEVFEKAEFVRALEKHFVLVALDFPRSPQAQARVPDPRSNGALQALHGVTGFPTVLLLTPGEHVYGRSGYRPGGWKAYLAHVDALRTGDRTRMRAARELAAAYEHAKDAERPGLRGDAVRLAEGVRPDAPFRDLLVPLVRAAIADEGRTEAALRQLLRLGASTPDEEARAAKLDPQNTTGLLELVVDRRCARSDSAETVKAALADIARVHALGLVDKEVGGRLCLNAAHWYDGVLGDREAAVTWAGRAKELVGRRADNAELLDRLLGE